MFRVAVFAGLVVGEVAGDGEGGELAGFSAVFRAQRGEPETLAEGNALEGGNRLVAGKELGALLRRGRGGFGRGGAGWAKQQQREDGKFYQLKVCCALDTGGSGSLGAFFDSVGLGAGKGCLNRREEWRRCWRRRESAILAMNKKAILTVVLVLLGVVAPGQAAESERMNILFVFGDDWGRIAGAYAGVDGRAGLSDVVKTPNIDRMAREGMLFKRAFVNSPSCTPCRSALLSGQYFFRTGLGAILRGAKWDASIPTFPLLLRDSGYHIGKSYKVWSPGTPADAPFGGGKYAFEKSGKAFNQFSENATGMVAKGMEVEAAKGKLYAEVAGNFDAFLAARPAGAPFLYWFGPTNTHRAWTPGSGKKLWGIDPASLTGKLPKFIPDVPEVREDFADYLGEIQALDAAVGVLLDRLAAAGELEKTVIVLSGDHGPPGFPGGKCNLNDFGSSVPLVVRWPGGKGGRVIEDLVDMQDMAPTFLELGGVKAPEVMTGRSLLKVLKAEGSGQIDPERTWVVNGRERHVDTAREGNLPYPHRALRTREFLYIRNFAPERWPMGSPGLLGAAGGPSPQELGNTTRAAFADMDAGPTKRWLICKREEPEWKRFYDYAFGKRPGEELYDLAADPDQMVNLAGDPAHAEVMARLAAKLTRVLTEARDPRVLDGGKMFENPPFTEKE